MELINPIPELGWELEIERFWINLELNEKELNE
jgi:hypothetical protein